MKTFHITKANFLKCYFSGSDQEEEATLLYLGNCVKDYLETNGVYNLEIQHLFEEFNQEWIDLYLLEENNQFKDTDKDSLHDLDYEWELKLIDNKYGKTLFQTLGDAFRPKNIQDGL